MTHLESALMLKGSRHRLKDEAVLVQVSMNGHQDPNKKISVFKACAFHDVLMLNWRYYEGSLWKSQCENTVFLGVSGRALGMEHYCRAVFPSVLPAIWPL